MPARAKYIERRPRIANTFDVYTIKARALGTKVGVPVLIREHTWYVGSDQPVQYGTSIFRGDRYQMSLEFSSTPSVTLPPT